ncbi:MAG: DMT family transporter [Bacteroides sp.]|nr:DMT family transporter [Eubacterium sp.]MCM1417979.1 DMT family transporter [Roseburia sp.]MCM1461774.1 DMT family transporter [Bacteroides sp.]
MNKVTLKNSLLLFLTALIWGSAFVTQAMGGESMGAFTFTAARSLLGGIVLIPVILFRRAREKEKQPIPWRITLIGGVCCGLALTAAALFQQFGIMGTTVGKSGFITALYIIFTPILGIAIGRKAPPVVWIAALIAVAGMYLLCIDGSLSIGTGDLLVLICSVLFAVHILVIDRFSPLADGVMLSCIQFFTCAVVSGVLALIFEEPSLGQVCDGAIPILYAGILSSGVGYTLQIVGQKGMNPTAAALILSLESVISTIAGYLAYKIGFLTTDQTMTARQIAGCVVVFAAVVLVQVPIPRRRKEREG